MRIRLRPKVHHTGTGLMRLRPKVHLETMLKLGMAGRRSEQIATKGFICSEPKIEVPGCECASGGTEAARRSLSEPLVAGMP